METENKHSDVSPPITHIASQISFRIIAAATSIAAACFMFNSRQSKMLYGTNMDARYTYSPAFKFFTMMNVVACGCSVLSLLPVFAIGRTFTNSVNFFFLFLHDLTIAMLLAGGTGAATTVAQVGKFGNNHAGWMPICDNFGKFCHKVAWSLIFGYMALFCYLVLVVLSAYKARQIQV
ncbi:hypothetical protein SSX86_025683 [Deinandra increscens subsp. villosa]|uniref:CASP-like protein n=1 Tax=Deinandra increscens subsp. villosa TaxID=3103831 RepID=A0AAP0CD49_9ASTR